MRILLVCFLLFVFSYSQAQFRFDSPSIIYFGLGVGFDQHVAGGGPHFDFIIFKKDFKISVGLATQINILTPYKFNRFDGYRYAKNINEMFGGQFSVSYSIKQVPTPHPIFPIVMYRSNYFNTHFGRKIGDTFSSSSVKGFSTIQGFSAGIQAYFGKGFMVDFMVGGGVYIFKDTQVYIAPGEKYRFDVRPDFNVNASVCYIVCL